MDSMGTANCAADDRRKVVATKAITTVNLDEGNQAAVPDRLPPCRDVRRRRAAANRTPAPTLVRVKLGIRTGDAQAIESDVRTESELSQWRGDAGDNVIPGPSKAQPESTLAHAHAARSTIDSPFRGNDGARVLAHHQTSADYSKPPLKIVSAVTDVWKIPIGE
jgi:hypothetical protein